MKPALDRSDQVVAHVVAWHNRHPLALRITPDQVHSVGVVSLPYAVRGAVVQPVAPALPAADPGTAAAVPDAPPATAAQPDPDAATAADDDAQTEVAIEAVVEIASDADGTAGPGPVAETTPAAPPEATASILDRALAPASAQTPAAAQPGAVLGASETAAAPVLPTPPLPLPIRRADLPPRPRRWDLRMWWQAWRGRATYRPLFSEDFIAPLRLHQVRRWVSHHGVGQRPLDAAAPHRLIMLDALRRRPGDEATEVDLHVITAAIGHDDTRHRLLLATDGAVLGQRLWSRPRLAAASGALAVLMGLAGGGWYGVAGSPGLSGLALLAPAAQPPASSSASSSAAAAVASAPASAAVLTAHAGPSAPVGRGAVPVAAPTSAATVPVAPVEAPTHETVEPPAPEAALATAPAPVPAVVLRDVNPRRGRVELPPLVPRLDAAERHEARTASRALRQDSGAMQEAKAWALVTLPSTDRRRSERVAAQLQAIALLQPVPMRAELMPAGDGWRAVFWPFHTANDAEKARLALADKGLRTELIEF